MSIRLQPFVRKGQATAEKPPCLGTGKKAKTGGVERGQPITVPTLSLATCVVSVADHSDPIGRVAGATVKEEGAAT